ALALVLVLQRAHAPRGLAAVRVGGEREEQPAAGREVAVAADHGIREHVEGPATGALEGRHEAGVELAQGGRVREVAENAVVVARVVREACERVLPARVVHRLHVLAGELADLLAILERLHARAQLRELAPLVVGHGSSASVGLPRAGRATARSYPP